MIISLHFVFEELVKSVIHDPRLSPFTRPPTSRPPSRRAERDRSPIHPASPPAPPRPPLRCQRSGQRPARRYPNDPRRQPRAPRSGNLSPLLGFPAPLFACASSAPPARRL